MEDNNCRGRFLTRAREVTPSSLLTFFLFSVFGVGSWLAVNGVWSELPVLVASLPECYHLPAVLSIVTQLANLGPILYVFVKFCLSRCSVRQFSVEIGAVYAIISIGVLSCAALALAWDETAVVADERRSVALIVLTFSLALVDCTSTLVFIPFMKHFPAHYITALYIGEGMSGVLPSMAALAQGFVNKSVNCAENYIGVRELGINFSPNVYFVYLGSLTIICGLAFTAIITLPAVRRQMIPASVSVSIRDVSPPISSPTQHSFSDKFGRTSHLSSEEVTESREERENLRNRDLSPLLDSSGDESVPYSPTLWKPETTCYSDARGYLARLSSIAWNNRQLLVCMFVLNFFSDGAIPSTSAYIFKPYGNTVYTLAANVGLLVGPLVTLSYVLLSHKSRILIAVLTSIASLLGIYLLVCAALSPDPPLRDSLAGKAIIVSERKDQKVLTYAPCMCTLRYKQLALVGNYVIAEIST